MGKQHGSHEAIIKRSKRAEGHLRKVITMIEAEEPCVNVAQQFHAVVRSLTEAKRLFIQDHIQHCLDHVADEGDRRAQKKQLEEFKEISKFL